MTVWERRKDFFYHLIELYNQAIRENNKVKADEVLCKMIDVSRGRIV